MSAANMYNTWSRVLHSESVSNEKLDSLLETVRQDHNVIAMLADDLVVDRILTTITEPESASESFVAGCIEKIREHDQTSDAPDIQTRKPASAIQVNKSMNAARGRRTRAKIMNAALATAGLVLIACLVVIWQNQSDIFRQSQQKTLPANTPDSINSASENSEPDNDSLQLPSLVDSENDASSLPSAIENQRSINGLIDDFDAIALLHSDEAVWESEITDGPVEPGKFNLQQGLAAFCFSEGEIIVARGPAQIEIMDEHNVTLLSGNFMIEVIDKSSQLTFSSRDAQLRSFDNVQIHLQVDDRGSEIVLASGTFDLERQGGSDRPLEMQTGDLDRAFVNNAAPESLLGKNPGVPIVVAHGPKRYFGQMGIGPQKKTSSSPQEFHKLLDQHFSDEPKSLDYLKHFHKRLEDLRRQFNDPAIIPDQLKRGGRFSLQDSMTKDGLRRLGDIQKLVDEMLREQAAEREK